MVLASDFPCVMLSDASTHDLAVKLLGLASESAAMYRCLKVQ